MVQVCQLRLISYLDYFWWYRHGDLMTVLVVSAPMASTLGLLCLVRVQRLLSVIMDDVTDSGVQEARRGGFGEFWPG